MISNQFKEIEFIHLKIGILFSNLHLDLLQIYSVVYLNASKGSLSVHDCTKLPVTSTSTSAYDKNTISLIIVYFFSTFLYLFFFHYNVIDFSYRFYDASF